MADIIGSYDAVRAVAVAKRREYALRQPAGTPPETITSSKLIQNMFVRHGSAASTAPARENLRERERSLHSPCKGKQKKLHVPPLTKKQASQRAASSPENLTVCSRWWIRD